ncbi:agmatinase [Acuticoccus sp. MNP-M23]|uniref:agmatinase n=1 Tax=Acuticoccus sp. MNP-M23 TaxID=3072793 RepID=UPI002815ABA3|nr:agmatinase [Acuticoccus sp. MNP-M23]WMS43601.1 agmatinase [Acuticoccus sp. MNP-M23]
MSGEGQDRAFRGGLYGTDEENWFAGATSLFRRRYSADATGADVAVLGIPFDQAVTNRPGARFGPRAIRAASTNLAWPGGPWRWSGDPFETLAVVDTGDVAIVTGQPHRLAEIVEARAAEILATGARLLSLGGDHFVSYPLLKAHAAKHGPLGLIQFDSHSDTWVDDGDRLDHGTMFRRAIREGIIDPARSAQIGIRSGNADTHGMAIIDADRVADETPASLAAAITKRAGEGPLYLTFDIDFLDPAYAPGTGTPVCGGPSTNKAERILWALAGLPIVGMDIVEVAPAYDHAEITALAAATMAMAMIGLFGADRAG